MILREQSEKQILKVMWKKNAWNEKEKLERNIEFFWEINFIMTTWVLHLQISSCFLHLVGNQNTSVSPLQAAP